MSAMLRRQLTAMPLLPEKLRACGCGRDTVVFGHETCWTRLDSAGQLGHLRCEGCRACGCPCHQRVCARASAALARVCLYCL